ncbi:DNA repair protein Sae2/CtIP [Penicillium longicatenatum]|uniref:DNA repair protein Sae2/CtIP n=1 Tax=Penicillium longicatenatum TaxID=1561947 RepID=UPI002548B995|nr:DNA repair protein Sae2/CtIP [Penicillium longicatenatum]KAJ5643098.1 DNA repair protein Sae2/CtIP [Penicillium longicatenatum]
MDILKELHVSITEACESSFDQAFQNLQSKLAIHQTSLTEAKNEAAIANEARQTAERRIQELQCEVTALRAELSHYDSSPVDLESPVKRDDFEIEFAPEHLWGIDLEDVSHLRKILETKYTSLYNDLQTYSQSWGSLKAKVLQHKKKLRYVDKQLQRDEFTLIHNGAAVTFKRVQNSDASHIDKATVSSSSVTAQNIQNPRVPRSEQPNSSAQNRTSSADTTNTMKAEEHSQQFPVSDQAEPYPTQSSPACEPGASESPSDVLHTLPNLQNRKRKRVVAPSQSHEGDYTGRPMLVKNETFSSSPLQHSNHVLGSFFPSTQDLDDIGDTVLTPTKRQARRAVHWADTSRDLDHVPGRSSVLQPVDGNTRTGGVSNLRFGDKRNKSTDPRAILSVSEDGDAGDRGAHLHSSSTSRLPAASAKIKPHFNITQGRLESLLEKPLPSKSPLPSLKGTPGRSITQDSGRNGPSRRSGGPVESTRTQSYSQQNEESASQSTLNVHPEDEPYRSRPLHRLTLGHFKLNPKRNDGLDYAYSEVVRKKDDRKCLAGCTQSECCGGRFRAMARLGGLPAKSSSEQEEEDQRALEEYMGEDYHLLEGLSAQDRDHLVVEARARAIANQYGKHRHNHQRARSPPGFWRTDMPSTQELEFDREAAQRQDREKVEERYREAMRPGGLWTWADE